MEYCQFERTKIGIRVRRIATGEVGIVAGGLDKSLSVQWENGTATFVYFAELELVEHTRDSDCTVDPETNLCSICGVEYSEPCIECGGHAFHLEGCTLSDATVGL